MRPHQRTLSAVGHALGVLLVILAVAMALVGLVSWAVGEAPGLLARAFGVPAAGAALVGGLSWWRTQIRTLDAVEAMLVCALGWIVLSIVGALPLVVLLDASWIDASFEVVSGFTTTGITVFTGLDALPRSAILWRALTQWIGGVGILSLFVALTRSPSLAHRLGPTEAHKIQASRPVPGPLRTLQFFALIYVGLTILVALGLRLGGVGWFDAITHAFTTLSTGGFSGHDASVAHWRAPEQIAAGARPVVIEWVIIAGMAAGGTSFVVHFRLARGEWRALGDGAEIRAWIGLLLGALLVLLGEQWLRGTGMFAADALETTHALGEGWLARAEAGVRTTLFQVLAIATTTGYATADIATPFWGSTARVLFLVLMCVGGCVGSTSGGFKVTRILLLLGLMRRELRRTILPRGAALPVVLDRSPVEAGELGRVGGLAVAWVVLLIVGTLVTTLCSPHAGWAAFSGVASALNNIGPCYMNIPEVAGLPPGVKGVWMLAMLVGRLEVLPLAVLFSARAWRGIH
ncbi:TrkH family potassium uptake protein [Pseudenhygromyxa sp. WMMC2535]|uniref:TrkH family potassium uptake protein n=1 Tax=Pseudenhygromyxa sp. WMMC2535 TaxID=2712867 RepID=UPI001556F221|nr:TrkH family potassium uptake protein [Pseudenhygromyxa sp. WMMC2535]NVB36629.1 TrkH family potassium uptake protein [Pseudenhygromyxa sp. WMMC2535]